MKEDRLTRLGPICAALFVIIEMAGVIVGSAGNRAMVTLGDPTSKILKAYDHTSGTGIWVGAYLELASLLAFGVFAAWLFRGRNDTRGYAGLLTAAAYSGVILVSMAVNAVLEYRAGHGMGAQETLALFDLQAALFTLSWGITGVFLLLAPVTGWLRRTAVVVGALSVVATAFPKAGPSQLLVLLSFVWLLAASVVLTRGKRATAPAHMVAARA
jgi:hypothetical protein